MSASCCTPPAPAASGRDGSYRRILGIALVVNASMFVVELIAGAGADSSALHADALDFLADAANYAISLFVLGAVLRVRATAALVKGLSMGAFGLWVVGRTAQHAVAGTVPAPELMGAVGVLALAANLGVAGLLYAYRRGDSNMRSVWLCTRNDAIGNVAVVLAASGVFATGRGWPDAVVALGIATLALTAAAQTVRQATREIAGDRAPGAAAGTDEPRTGGAGRTATVPTPPAAPGWGPPAPPATPAPRRPAARRTRA